MKGPARAGSPRVLVTGATGFIARNTLPALLARGAEVHTVTRQPHPPADGVHVHSADLLDPAATEKLLAEVQPEVLLHLAWKPLSAGAAAETEEESRPWLEASAALVESFARHGGRRVVGVGSCAEYAWTGNPCRERHTPLEPATPYGRVKHALHRLLDERCRAGSLDLAWARLFFLYGPHEAPRRLAASAILAALGEREAHFSHGLQRRDYLHAADAGEALAALATGDARGEFNVGSGESVALRELVLEARRLAGGGGRFTFASAPGTPAPRDDVRADTTLLRAATGWLPRLSLAEGLAATVAWWRQHPPSGEST